MAQPIIDFGKAIPADVRSWARILRNINTFVSKIGGTFVLSENTVFPVNESQVSGVRTFLPHPPMPPPAIESQVNALRTFMPKHAAETPIESKIDAIRPFLPRQTSYPPANDVQVLLASQIFGAH